MPRCCCQRRSGCCGRRRMECPRCGLAGGAPATPPGASPAAASATPRYPPPATRYRVRPEHSHVSRMSQRQPETTACSAIPAMGSWSSVADALANSMCAGLSAAFTNIMSCTVDLRTCRKLSSCGSFSGGLKVTRRPERRPQDAVWLLLTDATSSSPLPACASNRVGPIMAQPESAKKADALIGAPAATFRWL